MTAAKKLAREYELIYILRSDVGPSGGRKVSDRVTSVLEKQGARLTRVDQWGRRRLAYQIGSHTRGIFVYVRFVAFGDVVAELERNLRNLDEVVRFQTVRLEGLYDLAELQVEDDDVQFADVEDAGEDDDDPTFEEQLGMRRREPEREPRDESDESSDDDEDGDESEAKSDDESEAKSDDESEAKSDDEPEAKKPEAKSDEEPEADAEGDDDEEKES